MSSFRIFSGGRIEGGAGLECLLRERCPLRLAGVRGRSIRCTEGRAWITAPGLAMDVFLGPGEDWRCESDGLVLVEAMGRAAVTID
ncbi:MAG TPA: DUF2917 domain-containing protein [Rhodocyclaceae bacterium]